MPRLPAGQLSSPFQHTEVHQAHHDDPVQKAVNSGMGFIVGDILAQRLTGEAFDAVRSLELGLYGTLLDGPIKHMFNKTVGRAVGTGARAKLAKTVADNAIWMPVSTCLFFAVLKLAQGQPEEIVSSCQDKMLSMAVANHVLWPLAKFVNANLVPKQHQPVANKVVQVVWSAWLSTLGHAPSVMDLADTVNVHHLADTASNLVDKFVPVSFQDHVHTAVSNAINASVENFVSPFLEQAADAMDSASDVIERLPSAFLDKAFSKSLDVVTPFERMARSPSQLMEAGAVGAVAGAAAMPMGRAASHMLERHGPAMQKGAAHLMERSRHDISRATSNMAQLLERAASRAMEASQHFERAASKCLDDLDRSLTGRNSLDLAINQVLAGMGDPGVSQVPSPSPLKSPAVRRSRFQMQAAAAT
ncbi:hypothetical protein WJX77_010031 [Trebouxia sp. C0004]